MPWSRESPGSGDDLSPARRRPSERIGRQSEPAKIYHEREDTMRERADVLERGLLIGGTSVPARSAKLAHHLSPWDGEIYAPAAPRTPAATTPAAPPAPAAFP